MYTVEDFQKAIDPRKRVRRMGVSHYEYLQRVPRFVCEDGFNFSAQADDCAYCEPRDNFGPYQTVELGYPSAKEDLWMPYVEDEETPTDTVYARVPVELVVEVINLHGGFKCHDMSNVRKEQTP